MKRRRAECSGLAASWCPVHGDCSCPDDERPPGELRHLNDPRCPLHSPASLHAEVMS